MPAIHDLTRPRQVPLDFHTSGDIDRVAADFDPEVFAQTIADPGINAETGEPLPKASDGSFTLKGCDRQLLRVPGFFVAGVADPGVLAKGKPASSRPATAKPNFVQGIRGITK